NNNSSVPIILSNTIPSENLTIYKKVLDHLDFIAQRLGYPDDTSCDPDVLNNFIEKELYNRLGYSNFNIQSKKLYTTKKSTKTRKKTVARYCSMCGNTGYTKTNCPKAKKVNNILQYGYIDQSQSEDNESDQRVSIKKSATGGYSKASSTKPKTSKKTINENQIFLESVKHILTRYISQCSKEILIEIYTDFSKLFPEMKDSFYSYHSKNYSNKEVDKAWENITKKYQFILEPFFIACSEKDTGISLTSSNYCEKAQSLNYAIKQYQEAQLY
ncbi:17557_t:CDS:2, partial [Dentiscutata erythropus]